MKQFKVKKIYKKSHHPKYNLVKCENSDGSESYRLADSEGLLINDSKHYPSNFEDIISIHPNHKDKLADIKNQELERSVMGHSLDKEINKVQKSFMTLLEEVLIDI